MFRTVLTSLLAVLVLCGSAFAAEKTLIAAANPTWPPMEFLDENKNIIGYDRDIIAAIAEEIGMKSEFRNIAWDGIFASLESGHRRNRRAGQRQDQNHRCRQPDGHLSLYAHSIRAVTRQCVEGCANGAIKRIVSRRIHRLKFPF